MAAGRPPEDGELRLGPVMLPAGKRVLASQGAGEPVAWATRQAMPDAGRIWSALSDAHEQTGLVPVLLTAEPAEVPNGLAFDIFCCSPGDVTEVDHLDAAEVLRRMWEGSLEPEEYDDRPPAVREPAPSGRQFPGLAPPEDGKLPMARLHTRLGVQVDSDQSVTSDAFRRLSVAVRRSKRSFVRVVPSARLAAGADRW